jgi:hypothetical protein
VSGPGTARLPSRGALPPGPVVQLAGAACRCISSFPFSCIIPGRRLEPCLVDDRGEPAGGREGGSRLRSLTKKFPVPRFAPFALTAKFAAEKYLAV